MSGGEGEGACKMEGGSGFGGQQGQIGYGQVPFDSFGSAKLAKECMGCEKVMYAVCT
jgi:hypothetical protein